MKILVSLLPVLLFLLFLIYLDSFKLVRVPISVLALIWGFCSAVAAYFINSFLTTEMTGLMIRDTMDLDYASLLAKQDAVAGLYSRYCAPFVEEILKMLLLLVLIKRNKVGFMIDGAIYGFAIGAGFSLIENMFYLYSVSDENLMLWIVRGFGTALMHGGATGIVGILAMNSMNRHEKVLRSMLTGLLAAVVIHSLFNHFILSPLLSTLLILIVLPLAVSFIFQRNEKSLRDWLELEFDSEVKIIRMIRKGQFSQTKTGMYLMSIRERFENEIVLDLYCYISLYLELSMRAKSNLLLKEAGLPVSKEPDLKDKLAELSALQHNIGKTGLLAISPVLRMTKKDLWKLNLLEG